MNHIRIDHTTSDASAYGEKIGAFELPGGGEMAAYLVGERVICCWPELPLSTSRRRYYIAILGPAVIDRARQCLGLEGTGLWVLT